MTDVTLPGLERLAPDQQVALVAAVRHARERQRAVLEDAIDAAMEHVPRVLRGAMRKVLFG